MADERILVVEDSPEMRAIVGRVLGTAGYRVDLASTVTEARELDPVRYDAVLMDANLGAERGTDLIEELRAQDAAVVGRCLVITGGSRAALPDGVVSLAKPFQLAELLTAVRGLLQPGADRDPRSLGEPVASQGGVTPAAGPANHGSPPGWRLLGVIRGLRARERAGLADSLHDGPIQDLAAATLELQLLRRSAMDAQAPEIDTVLGQLDVAASSLRAIMAGAEPPLGAAPPLAEALQQQAAWLSAPLAVDTGPECAGLSAAEAAAAVDVAELMLFAMMPGAPPAQARAEVLAGDAEITVRLTVVPGPADGQAVVRAALGGLAVVLAGRIGAEFGPGRWRCWTVMPRALSPGRGVLPPGQGSGIVPAARPAASPDHTFSDQVLPRPPGLNAVICP